MQDTLMTTSSLLSIIGIEVAQTDTSFLGVLGSYSKNVSFSGNCNTSRCFDRLLLFTPLNGVGIISSCRGIVFLVPIFLKILSFFIYMGGLPGLSKLGVEKNGSLTFGRLWFLRPRLLGLRFLSIKSLGLDFWQGGIRRVVIPGVMDIKILDYSARS